jgi:hypothetical protein
MSLATSPNSQDTKPELFRTASCLPSQRADTDDGERLCGYRIIEDLFPPMKSLVGQVARNQVVQHEQRTGNPLASLWDVDLATIR